MRNLTVSLIEHGRIRTTVAKAKSLRPVVEKLVTAARATLARRDGESEQARAIRSIAVRRRLARDVQDRDVLRRLFDEVAPKFVGRPGGYTRIVRVGHRPGDNAPMAVIEFVEDID
jgi:large subunit ribosomal protein L17